ncbi:MAG: NADH-quinone oxidoreductase subunit H, partial [Elusimicrobiota bacterium]
SWIFRATPNICLGAMLAACFLIPVIVAGTFLGFAADLIALVYFLALPRFFMALAGLDAGSSFGGMGSSREMMIASVAEPALIMALFAAALPSGTTQAGAVAYDLAQKGWLTLSPGAVLAFVALLLVTLAECARIPVDNPATHLELTMVHEAMILEYSGRSLALMEWASMIKLTFFLTLAANLFFPWGMALEMSAPALFLGALSYLLKLGGLAIFLAFIETSTAKLRLFRVPDFLGAAFALALLGLLSQGLYHLW